MPVLSWQQVAAVAVQVWTSPADAVTATAITQPESSRDSTIIQAGQPYSATGWGLWQITPGDSEPQYGINQALLDPVNNARAAHAKWAAAGGFSPWTTYENGLEDPYLGQAADAVAAVLKLTPRQRAALAGSARAGTGENAAGSQGAPDWAAQIRTASGHLHSTAARHLSGTRALAAITGPLRAPAVTVPDPAGLLQPPERIRNAR